MKKIYILFFTILLLLSCTQKKSNKVSEKMETDSLSYFMKLINSTKTSEIQKFDHTNKALVLISKSKNTQVLRDTLFSVLLRYYNNQDWVNFNKSYKLLLANSKASKDSLNLAKSYRYRANYLKKIQSNDSAFYYYTKAE